MVYIRVVQYDLMFSLLYISEIKGVIHTFIRTVKGEEIEAFQGC